MAYALITGGHVTVPGTTGGTTSAAIDTTGASLLIFAVSRHGFTSDPTVSDSKGNTWNLLTEYAGFIGCVRVYYAINPTVGSGHTFTLTGGNTFPSAAIAAFSGADTSSPFDVENGNSIGNPSSTTIQTGSLTPSQGNSLVISALATAANGGPSGYTIDSGFTITDTVDAIDGTSCGVGLAYLIQTTATAENPTWTLSTAGAGFGLAATIDSWKPAAGGGGTDTVDVNDTVTVSESSTVLIPKLFVSVFDSVTVTENVVVLLTSYISLSDTVTITENINVQLVSNISVADNVTITENVNVQLTSYISVSDAVTVTENVVIGLVSNISVFDSVSISESVSLALSNSQPSISVFEAITVSEPATIFVPILIIPISDSVTTSESITLTINSFNIHPQTNETVTISESTSMRRLTHGFQMSTSVPQGSTLPNTGFSIGGEL